MINHLFKIVTVKRILTFTILCFTLAAVYGNQSLPEKYKTKEFHEGITISYKWKKAGLFKKKDAPLQLVLKIGNENPHRVLVRFRVIYYWKAVIDATSKKVQYCVKPNRKIRGKIWDLVFSSAGFTEEEISDDIFMWEIGDLDIIHDADCETRLNIKIKPEIRKMNKRSENE